MKSNDWLILGLLGLGAWYLFGRKDVTATGGAGSFIIPVEQPAGVGGGLLGKVAAAYPGAAISYAAVAPGALPSINVFQKIREGGTYASTYLAPTEIQAMIAPGPALPAPAPGIGLGPKRIML